MLYRKDRPDWVWDFYPESVKMSTYLVAFVVSDFGFNESPKGLSNTKFQIWSRKTAIDQVIKHNTTIFLYITDYKYQFFAWLNNKQKDF